MKEFTSRLAIAMVFAAFLTTGCGNRSQELPAADDSASTSSGKGWSSPGKAGARMEVDIKGVKVAFRWCPPGKFTRHWNKSTEDEWEKRTTWDDDKEDFTITLTKGFWLAETETTQELWQAVTGENPSSGAKTRKTPVNHVSWEKTQEFISKLNDAGYAPTGFKFCLPTEAQWEYACIAGTTGERYGELDAIAWYSGNSDGDAHEVGTKKANAWGLYDMLGNVWERCEDRYGKYPMKNLTDYAGPEGGSNRVIRGGSWNNGAEFCSRSYRYFDWDGAGYGNVGFRLSLVPQEK